jgi:hypothetical protein
MNFHWTFSSYENEWIHETFRTKDEAIQAAKYVFDGGYLVGQLNGNDEDEELTYMIENIEEVNG